MHGETVCDGLRERVVARVEAGETVRAVAAAFDVSVSAVVSGRSATARLGAPRRRNSAAGDDRFLNRTPASFAPAWQSSPISPCGAFSRNWRRGG